MKSQYDKFAEIIKNRMKIEHERFFKGYQTEDAYYAIRNIAHDFGKFFEAENPNFCYERFIKACGE